MRDMVGLCQSVIFGSLTLIWKFHLDFGDKSNFSKIRNDHVMLKFLATTESQNLVVIRREISESREKQ